MAEVKLPQLGESVTEGTIGRWLKNVGDRVSKYEALCEVVTDKVNAEIPSDFEGVLTEILVSEGSTVPVGTLLCRIESSEEVKDSPLTGTVQSEPAAAPDRTVTTGTAAGNGVRYSPAVMMLLQEHGLDPARITGTGMNGRITRKDVLKHLEQSDRTEHAVQETFAPPHPTDAPLSSKSEVRAEETQPGLQAAASFHAVVPQAESAQTDAGDTILPVSPIRKTIAKRMVESKHNAPHAWMMVEVDVTPLVKLRERLKDEFKRREGVTLTFLPFFIKAVTEALREYPMMNSVWDGDRIVLKKDIHISIAVAAEDSLFVPVIHHADRLSIAGIAHSISELAAKARSGKLSAADVQGGTFTVNNTGAFGSIQSMPIINAPQAAILSVESIVKRPVVLSDDAIGIRSMVNLCLSLDHRILDGLVCGRFLAAVKNRLQAIGSGEGSLF